MFVLKQQLQHRVGEKVKIIGRLVKIETPDLVLSTCDGDVRIVFRDLHRYTDKMVVVTGTVMGNLKISEECVDDVPDGFCLDTYAKMVKLSESCKGIFSN